MSGLSHLDELEAEAIYIIREVAAECEKPVMLYSIGKDSSVMLHLAMKAFYPEKPPFPFLHIDTTWKFREMIEFRDRIAKENGIEMLVYTNQEGVEAGLEHLGRGTTEGVDAFIVVIEPGARSVQTYKNVKRLASDLGVAQVKVVANKVRNTEDEEFIRSRIPAEDLLGILHYNTEVIDADRQGKSPYDFSKTVTAEIAKIKEKIDQNSSL